MLTPKQVHTRLAVLASKIRETAEKSQTSLGHFNRMVRAIREDEKAHQRFRPAGTSRGISLGQATNWFIVRCTVDALNCPNRTASELCSLREDYVHASLMVASLGAEDWTRTLAPEDADVVDHYSYPHMVMG